MQSKKKIRILIISSIVLLAVDYIYKLSFNITYQTRRECFLYQSLPRPLFLIYEYFIELSLILIVGIFIAVLLEKFFRKFGRFYPKNPLSAFIYASILPVCSCGALPLIESMGGKMKMRALITFIISAPLLNPYIIVISFTTLGYEYALLRILLSFILAIGTAYIVEFFSGKSPGTLPLNCKPQNCSINEKDVYIKSYDILKKVFPYLILAAAVGIGLEYLSPANWLSDYDLNNNIIGLLLAIIIGIPVYLCNGADVLLLKPLIYYSGLPMGTALAFSLTSTSVCFTSLILMSKFLGKKLTAILLFSVFIIVLISTWLVNLLF